MRDVKTCSMRYGVPWLCQANVLSLVKMSGSI